MICIGAFIALLLRVINGVKEMCGFRSIFNFSYSSTNETCSAASCSEDIKESTILVSLSTVALGGHHINELFFFFLLKGLIVSVFSLGCLVGALLAGGE